ncbi:MAG TPA: hypothetical protein VGL40_09215, partial [Bacillota bacterium]
GTFRAACGQHDGEADVHVQSLEVIARGHATEPPAAAHRWPIALGLVGVGLFLTALARGPAGLRRPA